MSTLDDLDPGSPQTMALADAMLLVIEAQRPHPLVAIKAVVWVLAEICELLPPEVGASIRDCLPGALARMADVPRETMQ